jgi:hypothetical protein
MERSGGETEMTSTNGRVESHMHLGSGPSSTDLPDEEGGRLRDLRDRASHFAENARHRVGNTIDRASGALDTGAELISTVRARPIVSLGAAFTTGFLLAAVTGGRSRHWAIDSVRRQLKTIVVGAATAAIANELRSMVDEQEIRELQESRGPDDEVDDYLEEDDLDPLDRSPY